MSIELSIIIGTKDRPAEYRRFKESVEKTVHVRYECIVGDASENPVYAVDTPTFRVLREDPPMGTLKGYNRCFREAQGKWVTWFNDDVELLDGWAEAAIRFMEESPMVGMGAIYFKDKPSQDADWTPFRVYDFPGRRFKRVGDEFMMLPGIPHPNFGVISRELGDSIGWFDEDMGAKAYGCDTSLSLRVVDAGKAVVRIPGCKVVHYRAYEDWQEQAIRQDADGQLFMAKYGPRIIDLLMKHMRYAHLVGPEVIE